MRDLLRPRGSRLRCRARRLRDPLRIRPPTERDPRKARPAVAPRGRATAPWVPPLSRLQCPQNLSPQSTDLLHLVTEPSVLLDSRQFPGGSRLSARSSPSLRRRCSAVPALATKTPLLRGG